MINLYYKTKKKGSPFFLPLLRTIAQFPFPKPLNCSCLDQEQYWYESKIGSFTSKRLLEYLDADAFQQVWIDNASPKRLNLYIAQGKDSSGLGLNNIRCFISLPQVRTLFIDLIRCHPLCYEATCSPDIVDFLQRNFTNQQRQTKTLLGWMEYFGKDALDRRGGFDAFESNPYVHTQRIHDGLLVQVGDNPDVFGTPEGEALLVNAINALPLLKQ
jgi:hypothetical protein